MQNIHGLEIIVAEHIQQINPVAVNIGNFDGVAGLNAEAVIRSVCLQITEDGIKVCLFHCLCIADDKEVGRCAFAGGLKCVNG